MAAYNKASGNTLYKKTYSDNKQIDKYLKSRSYTDDPICFALGWNTFSPETKEYDIDIRICAEQSPFTATDQVQSQMAKYNKDNLGKLNSTGFLQLMSLATDVIIQR